MTISTESVSTGGSFIGDSSTISSSAVKAAAADSAFIRWYFCRALKVSIARLIMSDAAYRVESCVDIVTVIFGLNSEAAALLSMEGL